jgi:hypothetical protein
MRSSALRVANAFLSTNNRNEYREGNTMTVMAPEANGAAVKLAASLDSNHPPFLPGIPAPLRLVIAASGAAEMQSALECLAKAAMLCGLRVTQKQDCAVTHVTGFSLSELVLSPKEIPSTDIEGLDAVLIPSDEGARELVRNSTFSRLTEDCLVLADSDVLIPEAPCTVQRFPFRKVAGDKNAALAAVAQWLDMTGALPLDALWAALENKLGASEAAKIRSALRQLL